MVHLSMEYLPPLSSEMDPHPLLEPRNPAYSHATVRRAFIVWLRCGQRNDFRDVCNYYHYLEALEDQLPADVRASSRNHEFSLFVSPPPTSAYQQEMFPNLYPQPQMEHPSPFIQNYQIPAAPVKIEDVTESYAKIEGWKAAEVTSHEIFDASQVFKTPSNPVKQTVKLDVGEFLKQSAEAIKKDEISKLNELNKTYNVDDKKGTSKQDILETSQMIKNYCKEQQVPLKNFLENFKEYATRCELTNTVNNVGYYIKSKMIHAELTLAVMVHRAKINNGSRTKTPPKLSEIAEADASETGDGQTKTKPIAKIAPMNLQKDKDTKTTKIEKETERSGNITFTEDLITFDNNTAGVGQSENVIRLLRREDGLKTTAGFSNMHNIAKLETLKCRKI